MNNIKFVGLGGLDEQGKNMYIIEIDNDIFVLDAGHKYPDGLSFGINLIIPNFSYLVANKERIKGIIISHAHEDQYGALPYLLKQVNIPIFATSLSAIGVKYLLDEHMIKNYQLNVFKPNEDFKIGQVTIRPFKLTHTFPDHVGIALVKNQNQVIYTTDFIIDPQTKWQEYATDFKRIKKIASEAQTKLLLCEAYGIKRNGFVAPQHSMRFDFKKSLLQSHKRLIIGAYEQKLFQLKEMIEETIIANKRIIIYGRPLNKYLGEMAKLGWLKIPEHLWTKYEDINKYDDCVVFITGTGDKLYSKLSKIATGEDDIIHLQKTDSVLITSTPIPGTELKFYSILNNFCKQNIKAEGLKSRNVVSAHAGKEDVKTMISYFNPGTIIPIKGRFKDFVDFEEVAASMNIKGQQIKLLDNGEMVEIINKIIKKVKKEIITKDVYIGGVGFGNTGATIVRERQIMSDNGIIFISLLIARNNKEYITQPNIDIQGVVQDEKVKTNYKAMILEIIEKSREIKDKKGFWDVQEAKQFIRKKTFNLMRKKADKTPIIVPFIIEA